MTKSKVTRRAIFTSALSLLLCMSMLLGTTFAWFTDSATSTNNIIQSGTLNVELYYQNDVTGDTWTKVDENTNIFKTDTLWEPGHVETVKLKVTNEGTLALKYQLGLNVVQETTGKNAKSEDIKLSDILLFGTTTEAVSGRADAISKVSANAVPLSTGITEGGELDAPAPNGESADELTMVVYMPETIGNEANYVGTTAPSIYFGLNLVATQNTVEEDSFGDDYDAQAAYPKVTAVNVMDNAADETELSVGAVSVTIPAGAQGGQYKLIVDKEDITTDNGTTTADYDISLLLDGQPASGVSYPVEIQLDPMLKISSLTHNGTAIDVYDYEELTGILSFTTDSFSPFAVTYTPLGREVEVENLKITHGYFTDVNPADYDPTLTEADSEYIAVKYTAGGKTCYAVSERATTKVLVASDTVYDTTGLNYTTTPVNGNMYSILSGLQNNAHSTVYMLPGTYTEATTINVYSSMDIIGLGDKDTVKVIKGVSSGSNRHLFNCNGQQDEYIQVTLRNLYLEAINKNKGSQDNAAVQSIRRTKVKCYDLTIVKQSDWSAHAFYANGNNSVGTDPAKIPGYLYAENCTVNGTSNMSVRDYNGSALFYHYNVTLGNGNAYTENSSNVKNVYMAADDWTWD